MPDPNPIALPTVDRLTPLTLQLARSGLEALLPNGNMVKARVAAMLAEDVAQLETNGQKVEVSTSQALEVGTTLSVAVNRTGRSLELVIRPDTNILARHRARSPVAYLRGATPHQAKRLAAHNLWRFRLKIGFLRHGLQSIKRF